MSGKTIGKIIFVVFILLSLLVLAALQYAPVYIKNKMISYVHNNTEYELGIETLLLGGSSLSIKGVTLKNKENEETYFKRKKFQTDWIGVKVESITFEGVDWKTLVFNKIFFAEKLLITGPDIYVFRDKRMPTKYVYKPMPSALFRELTFPFTVQTLLARDGKVVYEEVTEKTEEKIRVPFTRLYATFYHFSSDPVYISEHPVTTIDAQALLFDSVKAEINYTSNTLDERNLFTLQGNVRTFSATLLNQCIEPATNVVVEDGLINKIVFKFNADENVAKGTVNMDYEHLKLKVLKEKEDKKTGEKVKKKSGLKTFLANAFVRTRDKDKDETKGEALPVDAPKVYQYTGEIHFERRKDRFIFNYWWNALKSGIASSVVKVPVEKTQK
jgi:hypothetical protein